MERSIDRIIYFVSGLSFIGFIDSLFLSVKHITGGSIPCSILKGCDVVTTSVYSEILGIPVSFMGVAYYLALFLLSFYVVNTSSHKGYRLLWMLPIVGFLMSSWFVYAQVIILKAFCLYCLVSAVLSLLLLFISVVLYKNTLPKQE